MGKTFDLDEEVIIGLNNPKEQKKSNSNNKKKSKRKEKEKNKAKNKEKKQNKNKVKKEKASKKQKKVVNTKPVKEITPEQQIKRKRLYRLLKIIVIVLILLTAILFTMFSPLFNVKEVKVSGNNRISTETIMSFANIEIGQNTYKINTGEIKKKLKENPYIDKVEIVRELPSTIEIKITERVASYILEYGNGYVYISNQGYILEISDEKSELPVLQGTQILDEDIKVGNRLPKEDLKKLAVALKIVDVTKQIEIYNMLTGIDISDNEDYKVMFATEQKVAHLGDSSNLVNKMQYIKMFIEDEKGTPGEIFVNLDLNKKNPYFRAQV